MFSWQVKRGEALAKMAEKRLREGNGVHMKSQSQLSFILSSFCEFVILFFRKNVRGVKKSRTSKF